MSEVVFVDTSVLLNVLDVPHKNSDRDSIVQKFKDLARSGSLLVIPIAAVVEVGNHLAQLPGTVRRDRCERFTALLHSSLGNQAPWVVSGTTWDQVFLRDLLDGHASRPGMIELCTTAVGTGDGSILLELERYRSRSDVPSALPVRLWTLDQGLQAYA